MPGQVKTNSCRSTQVPTILTFEDNNGCMSYEVQNIMNASEKQNAQKFFNCRQILQSEKFPFITNTGAD